MSDKQTQAVIFNFKEQRRLEKAIQALKIEEAYAVSLINLDGKVLKIGYKRLKDRVAKTKSHLTPDQINEMKKLEEEGKVPERVVKMESEVRIAAAEKRLKLWSAKKANPGTPRLVRAQTARELRTRQLEDCKSTCSSVGTGTHSGRASVDAKGIRNMRRKSLNIRESLEAAEAAIKISNKKHKQTMSVTSNSDTADDSSKQKRKVDIQTDAFMSAPNEPHKRRKSVDIRTPEEMNGINESFTNASQFDKESRPILKPTTDSHVNAPDAASLKRIPEVINHERNPAVPIVTKDITARPQSEGIQATRVTLDHLSKKRPFTSVPIKGNDLKEKSLSNDRRFSKLLSEGKTRTPFSSHDVDQETSKSAFDTPFRSIRDGPMSTFENQAIGKDHGDDLYREMKKGLILNEVANSLNIEDKIDAFFEKMDEYISENNNSPVEQIDGIKMPVPIFNTDTKGNKKAKPERNRLRRRELEQTLHGNKGNESTQQVWKDVNKCRYLRVPEELIDLTGIQTLASDQMKLFEMLRRGEYA